MKHRHRLFLLLVAISGCGVNAAERNNTGNRLYEVQAYDEAIRAYQAAQVVASDLAVPYVNAASAYAQMGRLDRAQAALIQALKMADGALAVQAYYNIGNIYFEMQLFSEAVDAYQHVLLLSPDDEDARYNLELALSHIIPPTDTQPPVFDGLEMLATPTGDSVSDDTSNLTPSPEASTPIPQQVSTVESQEQNPSPQAGTSGTMTQDEAERMLDAVQQNTTTLSGQLQESPVPETVLEKDW
jgi:tetratricopeptide (TPR) repeat protein